MAEHTVGSLTKAAKKSLASARKLKKQGAGDDDEKQELKLLIAGLDWLILQLHNCVEEITAPVLGEPISEKLNDIDEWLGEFPRESRRRGYGHSSSLDRDIFVIPATIPQRHLAKDAELLRHQLEKLLEKYHEHDEEIRGRVDEIHNTDANWQAAIDKSLSEGEKRFEKAWKMIHADAETELNSLLEQLGEQKRAVESIVNAVGMTGFAADYGTAAANAKKEARVFQFLTLLALGGLVFFAVLTFFTAADISSQALTLRILGGISFLALAGYAASQARRSHHNEDRNRSIALQLNSIGPFIAPLPTGEQFEIRKEFTRRVFPGSEEGVVAVMAGPDDVKPDEGPRD